MDPEEATVDLCNDFKQAQSTLIVPFKENQNENLVDLWVQLISNTQIFDIHVIISKCGLAVKLTQVWMHNMTLFNPNVLLRPFKDKKGKRLYGKDNTYTTAYNNSVKSLKGGLSNTCLR